MTFCTGWFLVSTKLSLVTHACPIISKIPPGISNGLSFSAGFIITIYNLIFRKKTAYKFSNIFIENDNFPFANVAWLPAST